MYYNYVNILCVFSIYIQKRIRITITKKSTLAMLMMMVKHCVCLNVAYIPYRLLHILMSFHEFQNKHQKTHKINKCLNTFLSHIVLYSFINIYKLLRIEISFIDKGSINNQIKWLIANADARELRYRCIYGTIIYICL